jgi:hypothetical protein
MKITTEQMAQHVVSLATRHRITIWWWTRRRHGRMAGEAFLEHMEISIWPIRSALSYATALHELGHCLGRYQTSRSVLVVERWAWRWAKANALVWTDAMDRDMTSSMAWYEARAPGPLRDIQSCQPPESWYS